jgi:hypothetical protein
MGRARALAVAESVVVVLSDPGPELSMLQLNHEAVPDAVPLTQREKALKAELEAVVRAGFETFMRVGEALCEIRRHRLFRAEYITFSDYVRSEFGMALSTANGLLRSAEMAQQLVDDGIQLPADTLPSALKALTGIPPLEGLRTVVWQYAQSLSPARGREGYQRGPKKPPSAELRTSTSSVESSKPSESLPVREQPFLRPATRLATFTQFSPELVVSSINQPANALTAYRICDTLVERLRLVQQCLEQSFPELCQPTH